MSIEILLRSAEEWNEYIRLIEVDLQKVNLQGANLFRANLQGVNLQGVNLQEANLCEANLCGADLCGADLQGANLCGANLCGADLCGANLCGADLCEADLCGADLFGADLCGADLCGANLWDETVSLDGLLEALVQHVKTGLYDQSVWGDGCGTPCCLAGRAAQFVKMPGSSGHGVAAIMLAEELQGFAVEVLYQRNPEIVIAELDRVRGLLKND